MMGSSYLDPDGSKTNEAMAKQTSPHVHPLMYIYVHKYKYIDGVLSWPYSPRVYVHTHVLYKHTQAYTYFFLSSSKSYFTKVWEHTCYVIIYN